MMIHPTFKTLTTPWGSYEITRMPLDSDPNLQGWDGADKLILETLADQGFPKSEPANISALIINDQHGALATVLSKTGAQVSVVMDSFRSRSSLDVNVSKNLESNTPKLLDLDAVPQNTQFDLVIVKVPKSHDMLDDQLRKAHKFLTQHTLIMGGGLTKNVHKKTIQIFEKYFGSTPTTKARYKSRLLIPTLSEELPKIKPTSWPKNWTYNEIAVVNYPGVFCESLDMGSRFLLKILEGETNPAKFTKEGRVTFMVAPVNIDGLDCIEYTIADTGVGMEEEQLSRIFDRFVQLDNHLGANIPGSGLGLSICRDLCHLLNGDIFVESKIGLGTTFRIVLPRLQAQGLDSGSNKLKVLLVDDDSDARELWRDYLTAHGYQVFVAESGEIALMIFKDSQPDVVVTDLIMPGMMEHDLVKAVREINSECAIVATTGKLMGSKIDEDLQSIVSRYYENFHFGLVFQIFLFMSVIAVF